MASVLITGGTGTIGKALSQELVQRGYSVVILSRSQKPADGKISYKVWDPEKGSIDPSAFDSIDHIVHLAGANVAESRWTEKRKQEIVDSRVKSGQLLRKALAETPNSVKSFTSASAIGWYGPDAQVPDPRPFKETDPVDDSFLGTTAREWEASVLPIAEENIRLVILRIGIVLSNEGGAYAEFKKPLRFGVASVLGSGEQIVSWIHIDDLVRLIIFSMENTNMAGVYNAVAPRPVSNGKLMSAIAAQTSGLAVKVPVPSFVLKLMLGEMSVEVLKSTTVSSSKVVAAGFDFKFRKIEDAVADLK
jgi:uncharacterized protein (TIGR01777 family)